MIRNLFFFVISFIIVAWGQPDNSSFLCLLASGCGFAFFWILLFSFPHKKTRFLLSSLWFIGVQAVQLSWLATPEYQGNYIFFVYGFAILFLGVQFGFLSLLFPETSTLKMRRLLGIASTWTLIEWSRLHILCGFAWNPIGLAMTAFPTSSQLAAVCGVFGLSFWVAFVNLFLIYALTNRSWIRGFLALIVYLVPFIFGFVHIHYHDSQSKGKEMHVALIQTSLSPLEKSYFYNCSHAFVCPYKQWESMIFYLEEKDNLNVDLIVMPEYAVPFSAHAQVYLYTDVLKVLHALWGFRDWSYLLVSPLAEKRETWYVNNLFWAQALADYYAAEVVLGLDDADEGEKKSYNAAFHLRPYTQAINRYEKRVLLPLAEYLPFSFLRPLVARYGITDFFTHGTKAKVFQGTHSLSISICYEECFGYLIRKARCNGAQLFVNVTNDAWYPSSRLHLKHYFHGKLRAIENGVPLVRACNTGVTAAVDSLGRMICQLGTRDLEMQKGALIATLNLYTYPTIYAYFGDYLIVFICLIFIILSFTSHRKSP